MAGERRLDGLEILRAVCAVSILLSHYSMFWFVGGKPVDFVMESEPLYGLFYWFYNRGSFAVHYFWCISGFIFHWKYQKPIAAGLGATKFFVLRFSRLYPLHFATLIVIVGLQFAARLTTGQDQIYQQNTVWNFMSHLVMLGNLQFPANMSFNGPIWSVSFEVIIYTTFYLTCRFIRQPNLFILAVAATAGVACVIQQDSYRMVSCAALFYSGCVASICYSRIRENGLAPVVFGVLMLLYVSFWLFWEEIPFSGYVQLVVFPPLTVLWLACLPQTENRIVHAIAWLGNLTYSSYLIHFPLTLLIIIVFSFFHVRVPKESLWFFLAFYSVVWSTAYISFRYFEMPAQQWLRKIFRARFEKPTIA